MVGDSEKRPAQRPWWVRLGLWGLPNRGSAVACAALALAIAVAGAILAWWDWRGWLGLLFLIGAAWYWFAVRWVDRHDSWH
jgi:hypothetical protein